jgi:hypothetical protein
MVTASSARTRSAFVFLIIVSTSGCGDERKGSTTPAAVFEVDDFCRVTLEALCARQIACNVSLVNQATDETSCLADAERSCRPELAAWSQSVAANLATFDASALAECTRELGEASCRELAAGGRPDSCATVFVGAAELGEPCYTDVECVVGTVCANAGVCPGACSPADPDPAETFDCRVSPCPEGKYCEGARCSDLLGQGAECRQQDACGDFYFCGKDTAEPDLRCRVKKSRDLPCFSRADCREPLACRVVGSVLQRTCLDPLPEAAQCVDTEECDAGFICASTGRCEQVRAEGELCAPGECGPRLYCWERGNVVEPTCRLASVVAVPQGEACNPDFDRCGLGLYCRATAPDKVGTCELMPVLGESCADFTHGLFERCRQGVCAPRGDDLVCVPLQGAGDPCETSEECVTRSCVQGNCAALELVSCQPG